MNKYKKAYDVIDTILHLMYGEKRENGYEPTHDEMVEAMDDLKKLVGRATPKEYFYYGNEYFSVPDDKINRKEEKEMKRTFRLRKKNFNFDKKGMILKGVVSNDGRIFVRAWDIYLNNKDIMSDEEVEICFINGSEYIWCYKTRELESLNPIIPLSKLEYDLLEYYNAHGYQYIARDANKVLFVYDTKPVKMHYEWEITENIISIVFDELFSFVKWEDEEPYSITYILDNCEVVENE